MAVIAKFKKGYKEAITEPLTQYDKGQTLIIVGLELPDEYEVHFSNQKEGGMAASYVGDLSGVHIPNILLTTGDYIYAWVYVTDHNSHEGKTEYSIVIPVNRRSAQYPTSSNEGVINGFTVDDNETLVVIKG